MQKEETGSLNGLIQSTNEMERKQDFIYPMQFWEKARKFEKFIGRWKLVKWEWNGVEQDISHWTIQSYSFEPVPEGVMLKQYRKDGSGRGSWILTTDEEMKNKLDKEGKNCRLAKFHSYGSFEWWDWIFNVEGNNLIHRRLGNVSTYEKG